jgi:NAD(P)-dependent dehydrogenase (short-subunit alcohol dehydrogenase family)
MGSRPATGQARREMMESTQVNTGQVALIIGGGPGISASCARLFGRAGMRVAVAARNLDKPVLKALASEQGVHLYQCDASDVAAVAKLFVDVKQQLGTPKLVVHNIDGRVPAVFRQSVADVDPKLVLATLTNSTFSAFLIGQQAASQMLAQDPDSQGHRGTIVFTNASAALKGYPKSAAFAMASQGKAGLAQSMARELMPAGIHVAHVPIDAAVGWRQADGTRAHRLAGTTVDDNMADPDRIAEFYLQLHNQHRSTWAFEVVLRPWLENW